MIPEHSEAGGQEGVSVQDLSPGLCYSSGFSFRSAISLHGREGTGQEEDGAWCIALARAAASRFPGCECTSGSH